MYPHTRTVEAHSISWSNKRKHIHGDSSKHRKHHSPSRHGCHPHKNKNKEKEGTLKARRSITPQKHGCSHLGHFEQLWIGNNGGKEGGRNSLRGDYDTRIHCNSFPMKKHWDELASLEYSDHEENHFRNILITKELQENHYPGFSKIIYDGDI